MIVVEHAITLTQPWATLMALGFKGNETRCWPTRFRGWIAIHSAKSFPMDCRALCYRMPFARALSLYNKPDDLPLGQILAVVEMIDCQPTGKSVFGEVAISDEERAFGDYSPDRFFFVTHGVRRLKQPIPIKGALGIWKLQTRITEADLA